MSHLPVIVGFGGVSPAGRSSGHQGYRRLVIDRLKQSYADETVLNLAVLRGLVEHRDGRWQDADGKQIELNTFLKDNRQAILDGTLIRKLDGSVFNPDDLLQHQRATLKPVSGENFSFTLQSRHLPNRVPENWQLEPSADGRTINITVSGGMDVMLPDSHTSAVHSAGQLPSGFRPDALYPSRNHPRGLQMTVYGISDALNSMGIEWDTVLRHVPADRVSVYAGSSMGQLDQHGNGGMLQARLLGKKVMSKQLPLAFCEMPADFINAYVLGNLGTTGCSLGACATFHYNLQLGIRDIQRGSHRVAIVGGSEAPIVPEIIEGFVNMGALADDTKLRALDGRGDHEDPDYRRASRPFGQNVGFTLGESAQFVILMDDELALELGANIHGAVNDVYINADGYKKSIASPGVGNYLTMAKAAASTRAVLGEKGLRNHTFVQAHGTSTPQNRTTESAIFHNVAREFGIDAWPVSAVKAYLGHSLCCSGADQLMASLGVWQHGILPGIVTTNGLADDVETSNLNFMLDHQEVDTDHMQAVLLNAKGFGGNNATASILSPFVARDMLVKKHGSSAMTAYARANEAVAASTNEYNERTCREDIAPYYRFDNDVREGKDLSISDRSLSVRGYPCDISLDLDTLYPDMIIK